MAVCAVAAAAAAAASCSCFPHLLLWWFVVWLHSPVCLSAAERHALRSTESGGAVCFVFVFDAIVLEAALLLLLWLVCDGEERLTNAAGKCNSCGCPFTHMILTWYVFIVVMCVCPSFRVQRGSFYALVVFAVHHDHMRWGSERCTQKDIVFNFYGFFHSTHSREAHLGILLSPGQGPRKLTGRSASDGAVEPLSFWGEMVSLSRYRKRDTHSLRRQNGRTKQILYRNETFTVPCSTFLNLIKYHTTEVH